jgi:uncharacterized protein
MIALDTNMLVYAHRPESTFHYAAKKALVYLAEGRSPWAIPWPCVHEFFSITTNHRNFKAPTLPADAILQLEFWMESPTIRLLSDSSHSWQQLKSSISSGSLKGGQVHDARIHAICQAYGVSEFWTADRDFSRMRGLTLINPCLDVRFQHK